MRRSLLLFAAVACLALAPARAEGPPPNEAFGPNEGQVVEVDRDGAEMTIRHGYIPELAMDPMAMVFTVGDRALFDKVQPGDRVKFKAGLVNGRFGIEAIESVQPRSAGSGTVR